MGPNMPLYILHSRTIAESCFEAKACFGMAGCWSRLKIDSKTKLWVLCLGLGQKCCQCRTCFRGNASTFTLISGWLIFLCIFRCSVWFFPLTAISLVSATVVESDAPGAMVGIPSLSVAGGKSLPDQSPGANGWSMFHQYFIMFPWKDCRQGHKTVESDEKNVPKLQRNLKWFQWARH